MTSSIVRHNRNTEFESGRQTILPKLPSFETLQASKMNLPLYPVGIQVHSIELNSPWQHNSSYQKREMEFNYQTQNINKKTNEGGESLMIDGSCQTKQESEAELLKKNREIIRM